MTTTPPPGSTCTTRGFGIDPRLDAAIPRALAASREDSHPQAIHKFHRLNSLDYRVLHGLPVKIPTTLFNMYAIALKTQSGFVGTHETWFYSFSASNSYLLHAMFIYTLRFQIFWLAHSST